MTTNFGRDTSCTTSMKTGRFVSGVRLIAEAMYRRLTTPRGMLRGGEEEQYYGLDLVGLVGSVKTTADEAALPGRITAEVTKDERVLSATTTVVSSTEGPATSWTITIEAETSEGPFTLRVGVNDLTPELLGITAED